MAKIEISKADASRNGVLLWYYGIESYLDHATTAEDYLALAERCGKLAAYCGNVVPPCLSDPESPHSNILQEKKKNGEVVEITVLNGLKIKKFCDTSMLAQNELYWGIFYCGIVFFRFYAILWRLYTLPCQTPF